MPPADTDTQHPNILLIHADQHRFDCLGAYGHPDIRTPNIDALAADGVRYENSFCPFPVCTPSRYSLLSGQYVHQHRGWDNHCTFPPGTETFPAILKQAGYKTAAVGKMHFTPTYLDVGFDEMVLAEQDGPGRWDDDYHRQLRVMGLADVNDLEDQRREYRERARQEYWDSRSALPSNLPLEWHTTAWTGRRAIEALEQWDESSNLLMVGFIKPHHPFDPPKEWADAYDPESLHLPPDWTESCFPRDLALSKGHFPHNTLTEEDFRRILAAYYANITFIDRQVNLMIDALERKGLYDNALIIFTSDHGDYMGCHHMVGKMNYMYDPVIKVPLIVKYPGGRDAGSVSDALVSNIDLTTTLLAQAHCAPAAAMKGLDLAQDTAGRELVFAESHGGAQVMARSKTRKLIRHAGHDVAFFCDLEKDPYEQVNCHGEPAYQDEVRALTRALDEWRDAASLPNKYLDEDAPVIGKTNVPLRHDSHRDEISAYYREKMAAAGAANRPG